MTSIAISVLARVILAATLLVPSLASALMLTVSFTGTGFPAGALDDPVSGSYTAEFDISGFTGSGFEGVIGTILAVDLTINGISYTPSTIDANYVAQDGVLVDTRLGTDIQSPLGACNVTRGSDDVCVWVEPDGSGFINYTVENSLDRFVTSSVSGEISEVPEPSVVLLLGTVLGLMGLPALASIRLRPSSGGESPPTGQVQDTR
jgi:hypothetical protein